MQAAYGINQFLVLFGVALAPLAVLIVLTAFESALGDARPANGSSPSTGSPNTTPIPTNTGS